MKFDLAATRSLDLELVRAFLAASHRTLAQGIVRFAAELPGGPDSDADAREAATRLCRALGAGGWLEPVRSGDFRACCIVRENLAYRSPLADVVFALQALGGTPIALAGDVDQIERWFEPAVAGSAVAAFAMTEPDAGSDLMSMKTSARRDGPDYVLDGRKTFISNAGIADFYTTFAVTDPEAGSRGITAFVVPADLDGVRFVRPLILSEPHPLGEIAFEDCRVPATHRLGEEGAGLKLGLATLDRLRPTVGAAACGMAGRALDEAIGHASGREQFGRALSEMGVIQEKLGGMATDLAAARLLVYRAAWERDGGAARTDVEAAMAKAFATEAAQRIVDQSVQILGGRGVLADGIVDRLYRSVRALRIYEGATEVQRIIIARHLLRAAGPPGAGSGQLSDRA